MKGIKGITAGEREGAGGRRGREVPTATGLRGVAVETLTKSTRVGKDTSVFGCFAAASMAGGRERLGAMAAAQDVGGGGRTGVLLERGRLEEMELTAMVLATMEGVHSVLFEMLGASARRTVVCRGGTALAADDWVVMESAEVAT